MPIRPVDIKKTDLQKLPNGMNAVGYVPGLNLYVRGPSSKQWIFRHTCKVCRTKHKVSIGIFPQDSLDDAVTNAYAARSKVGQGVCLKGEKYKEQKRIEVAAHQAITFSAGVG